MLVCASQFSGVYDRIHSSSHKISEKVDSSSAKNLAKLEAVQNDVATSHQDIKRLLETLVKKVDVLEKKLEASENGCSSCDNTERKK
jgi:cytochrome c556